MPLNPLYQPAWKNRLQQLVQGQSPGQSVDPGTQAMAELQRRKGSLGDLENYYDQVQQIAQRGGYNMPNFPTVGGVFGQVFPAGPTQLPSSQTTVPPGATTIPQVQQPGPATLPTQIRGGMPKLENTTAFSTGAAKPGTAKGNTGTFLSSGHRMSQQKDPMYTRNDAPGAKFIKNVIKRYITFGTGGGSTS